jgi:hypothetical protein
LAFLYLNAVVGAPAIISILAVTNVLDAAVVLTVYSVLAVVGASLLGEGWILYKCWCPCISGILTTFINPTAAVVSFFQNLFSIINSI